MLVHTEMATFGSHDTLSGQEDITIDSDQQNTVVVSSSSPLHTTATRVHNTVDNKDGQHIPIVVRYSQHLLRPNGSISGREVAQSILPRIPNLLAAIPTNSHAGRMNEAAPFPPEASPISTRPALSSIDGRESITHSQILECIKQTGDFLHNQLQLGRGHRIALVLPNGPELALSILAVTSWCSCVPLNAFGAAAEIESDLQQAAVDLVIGLMETRDDDNDEDHTYPPTLSPGPFFLQEEDDNVTTASMSTANKGNKGPAAAPKATAIGDNNIPMLAAKCGIPFCGLRPDEHYAGLFTLHQTPSIDNDALISAPRSVPSSPTTSSVYTAPRRSQPNAASPTSSALSDLSNNKGDMGRATTENIEIPSLSVAPSPSAEIVSETSTFSCKSNDVFAPNGHDDEILVLFTSGTTGGKKLVPHLLADVLVATACISTSWKLSVDDTNCNLMPLFHVGGIIRQVFSPILSGGCVICCPSFDPNIFWQLLLQQSFTWYYAAPTMHQLILQTGKLEGYLLNNGNLPHHHHTKSRGSSRASGPPPRLRMIANAAGGLLPSLARELRQAFSCHVLPSYGMTECMPITSPPATYQLEKPGTSGVSVGPEVAILCLETLQSLPPGKEGPICVRSEPCFRGYGILFQKSPSDVRPCSDLADANSGTFLPGGWFNTGDLGYMDSDGYLYITGRSKEVINRGGEIISPLEVEEAVNAHPDVQTCVAFSTHHSVLQEVVGLILVPVPNRPRVDLPALHSFLGEGRLAAPKWPQCLVYMDAVPKSHTNKLLRVRLGKRLKLPELNDSMYSIERTFEAQCPPIGTPVSVAIPCQRVKVEAQGVERILRGALIQGPHQELIVVPHPSKLGTLIVHVYQIPRIEVVRAAQRLLDSYLVPTHVCILRERDQDLTPAPEPSDAVGSIIQEETSRGQGPTDPLVIELQDMFQDLLDLDCLPAPETNFFNLGGSSMLASQLASKVRRIYNISFGGAEVFHHSSCSAIAKVIRARGRKHEQQQNQHQQESGSERESLSGTDNSVSMAVSSLFTRHLNLPTSKNPFDGTRMDNSSGLFATLFQLIPLFIVYPIWQLSRFFLFFCCLLHVLHKVPGVHSIEKFVATLVIFHFLWVSITPLIFVALKWIVIGKYRSGRYPIWGEYYLRWWFVDVIRKLTGRGIWGSNETLLNFYYRLLGANIGKNARISVDADIAEYDLVTIKESAAIEFATVRAFGVDNGCMILGAVSVGNFSSVGARSVVAPHTSVPDHCHLGPATSSYEISASPVDPGDDVAKHAKYNRRILPEPRFLSQVFIAHPITFFVDTMSHMPALFVLYWMVSMPWHHGNPFDSVGDLLSWLCDPRRIPFYIGIRVARATLAPLVYMMFAILVKRTIIGKFQPGPRDTSSEWQLIRHFVAARLFSRENMQDCTELLGRHYELVSALYRLLGAKVGKRVFWPGHQPVFTGEFDLLEIGDDVVFGSRACLFCVTTERCEKITLCAGSNVSDNTVVLPGSIIGKNAVLGSNTVCPAGRYLPEASIWLGSRGGEPIMLEKGTEDDKESSLIYSNDIDLSRLVFEGDETTLRPFGRAFYHRKAPYFVWPLPLVILYTLVVKILIAIIHTVPLLGALHITAAYYYGLSYSNRDYSQLYITFSGAYGTMLIAFFFTHFIRVVLWVLVELAAKWGIMGGRKEGRYNWDTSNYGQNWELYQILTKVRSFGRMNFLDFVAGTPYMASFFRWHGCKIGKDCCLYPAGGDPYMPEPDLVEIGNRCVIDCSSVVCHLNTRGNFELARIKLDNNVTLRSRSRIQQGVHMETGSMLLEKSLAMTGEIIETDSIWQGAPASRIFSYDNSSINSHATDSGSTFGAFV